MKQETIKLLTSVTDKARTMDITKESNFLEIVYLLNEVAGSGETDLRTIVAAHNMLVALNIMRTGELVFSEKFATRTLAVKTNLINFMHQSIDSVTATSTHEKILACKAAKSSLEIVAYQLAILQQKSDVRYIPGEIIPAYIGLNAEMKYLQDQVDSSFESLEALFIEECLADNLPDEIGDTKDEVDDLPDELTY